jgi:hypothetical protein
MALHFRRPHRCRTGVPYSTSNSDSASKSRCLSDQNLSQCQTGTVILILELSELLCGPKQREQTADPLFRIPQSAVEEVTYILCRAVYGLQLSHSCCSNKIDQLSYDHPNSTQYIFQFWTTTHTSQRQCSPKNFYSRTVYITSFQHRIIRQPTVEPNVLFKY